MRELLPRNHRRSVLCLCLFAVAIVSDESADYNASGGGGGGGGSSSSTGNSSSAFAPACTLVLVMLARNEEVHLSRTLPAWAGVADAWVIGLEEAVATAPEDGSASVIARALSALPGALLRVRMDAAGGGMGGAWTVLTSAAWQRFPHCAYGILADADFAPALAGGRAALARELASARDKYLFTVDSPGGAQRKLDWVYRQGPAVQVRRRMHQVLHVPPAAAGGGGGGGGGVSVGELASLRVSEAPGGWQDRAPGGALAKARRYTALLEADLAELGERDARSLYYLGVAQLDVHSWTPGGDGAALHAAAGYLARRAALPPPPGDVGEAEMRWFALIKLGEIEERWLRAPAAALRRYLHAARLDAARGDALFYAAQLLLRQPDAVGGAAADGAATAAAAAAAAAMLAVAAALPRPDRALFLSPEMYACLPACELARALLALAGRAGAPIFASAAAARGEALDAEAAAEAGAPLVAGAGALLLGGGGGGGDGGDARFAAPGAHLRAPGESAADALAAVEVPRALVDALLPRLAALPLSLHLLARTAELLERGGDCAGAAELASALRLTRLDLAARRHVRAGSERAAAAPTSGAACAADGACAADVVAPGAAATAAAAAAARSHLQSAREHLRLLELELDGLQG